MRKLTLFLLVGVGMFGTFSISHAADIAAPSGDKAIIGEDAQLEELWNEGDFTEGVAVAPDEKFTSAISPAAIAQVGFCVLTPRLVRHRSIALIAVKAMA